MIKDIEYYHALLNVLDTWVSSIKGTQNRHVPLTDADLKDMAGKQWNKVLTTILEKGIARKDWSSERQCVCYRYIVDPRNRDFREDARKELHELIRQEEERCIALIESKSNIKYGRKGYRMAWAAIVISIAAILLEIIKWIWPTPR